MFIDLLLNSLIYASAVFITVMSIFNIWSQAWGLCESYSKCLIKCIFIQDVLYNAYRKRVVAYCIATVNVLNNL